MFYLIEIFIVCINILKNHQTISSLEKNQLRYKNHSDRGLGEKYFLSYKKPQPGNTDTLIKLFDLKKVYQPFTSIHSDTL